MANSIAVITKYLPKVVDRVFAEESKTALLMSGGKYIDINFKEAGYVKIFSILMDGLSDYYRANHVGVENSLAYSHDNQNNGANFRDGYARGNVSGDWEIFKLRYDRGKQFVVDNMDNEETAGQIIANLLSEFLRTKVVPEVDIVRFSTIASKCNATLGNLVTETITENTALKNIISAQEWLKDHEVPEEDQILFVSPAFNTLLQNSTELTKFITQADFKSENGVTFRLNAFNGMPIVVVPSDRFYTDVIVGQNGYYPAATSKVINYMICSRKACVPIVKLEKYKIWSPETQDDIDGYKVNLRIYHDLIIPKNKVVGSYVSVSNTAATTKASLLELALKTGSVQNAYKVDGVYTTPSGMLGSIISSKNEFTLNSKPTINGATIKKVDVTGGDNVETEAKVYFAMVDGAGVVIAISKPITLTGIKHE